MPSVEERALTPKERAERLYEKFKGDWLPGRMAVEAAITEAVAAEREACAKIADGMSGPTFVDGVNADVLQAQADACNKRGRRIAAAIRAR